MSKTEVQMVNGEVVGLKDNMWKLSARMHLMEKFVQKQFGDVFWQFVQEHADPEDYDFDFPRSPTPPLAPAVTVTLIQASSASSNCNNSESSSNNSTASSTSSSGPPPPPPLIPASTLAALGSSNNVSNSNSLTSSSSTGRLPGARNFLPKSLAGTNNVKAKPVLRAASLSASDSQIHHGAQKINTDECNRRLSLLSKPVRSVGESILKSSLKASPTIATGSVNKVRNHPSLRVGNTPPTKPLILKRAAPIEYVKVDTEDDEGEPDDKRMNTIENLLAYNMPQNRSVNIIRTGGGIKAETDGYSAAHNGFLREMRPNPCHTRCQNRCHDIWTNKDRMDVFQAYWSIPTEDDRRQWVAERIERVDMATKKTEYSNFRTCTFKYYFPHPENPRVQVCKNFFLATIDEKRSYVEKIAQEVKGISEHYSVSDIPFRRKNQVKGANGSMVSGLHGYSGNMKQYDGYEAVGWMTGGGGMDGQDQEYDDEYGADEDVDGMEMDDDME